MDRPSWASALTPNSIAIIGASASSEKRGYQILAALTRAQQQGTFNGQLFPINPSVKLIDGVQCYQHIGQCPVIPELAIVCTPAASVPGIVRQCAELGVKLAVVLAAGFSEQGTGGKEIEDELLTVLDQTGIRLLGPNISGLFLNSGGIDLVGFNNIRPGKTAILSQSGNVSLELICQAEHSPHYGFSHYFGVGNQLDLGFSDLLSWLYSDEKSDSGVGYLEGIINGPELFETVAKFTQKKPLVLFVAGKSDASKQAAKSHTGALAGDYRLTTQLLAEHGTTLVNHVEDLLPVAKTLTQHKVSAKGRTLVLTDGGGHGSIAVDTLLDHNITLVNLSAAERGLLENKFPGIVASNPIDVAGIADNNPLLFADIISILQGFSTVDCIMWTGLFGGYYLRFDPQLKSLEEQAVGNIVESVNQSKVPVILYSLYDQTQSDVLKSWCSLGLVLQPSIRTAAASIQALVHRANYQQTKQKQSTSKADILPLKSNSAIETNSITSLLTEHDARTMLLNYGIPVGSHFALKSQSEITQLVESNPSLFHDKQWAIKINSADIAHKSDSGGVILNVRSAQEASEAFSQVVLNCKSFYPSAKLEGVIMTPMSPKGVELVIGCQRNEQFGNVVMLGLGGVLVELLEDIQFAALPIKHKHARQLIDALKYQKLLNGFRSLAAVDRDALASLVVSVGDAFLKNSNFKSLDLNPVIAHKTGLSLVDVRIETYYQESSNEYFSQVI